MALSRAAFVNAIGGVMDKLSPSKPTVTVHKKAAAESKPAPKESGSLVNAAESAQYKKDTGESMEK